MKKNVFSIIVILFCGVIFSGCIKNGSDRTIEPLMTGNVSTYFFKADHISPSLIKPQLNDTATALTITGFENSTHNKVTIVVTKYKGKAGVFSMAQGEAAAEYIQSGITHIATSGIVAIKEIGPTTITGYFQFGTSSGINFTNGDFVVGKPWDY